MTADESQQAARRSKPPRVWDAPVRTTHLLFIACVAGAWLTRTAEDADWHAVFGYSALALVAFRIAWGFVGPRHARFRDFAFGPARTFAYLRAAMRGAPMHFTGHNPAGSWAVFTLLALLAALGISGALGSAGLHALGPFSAWRACVDGALALRIHDVLAWAILVVAAAHVAGVAWGSRLHRENLVAAMLHGRKASHDAHVESVPLRAGLAVAIVAAIVVGAAAYLAGHVPRDTKLRLAAEEAAKASRASLAWTRECGSCHLAYPPGLLPQRSWARTFDEQDRHFGEDLSLSESTVRGLLEYAAATPDASLGATLLAGSAPSSAAPLRISELPFWRRAHRELDEAAFKAPRSGGRHDCEACHGDAGSGIFHPRLIRSAKPESES